MANVISAVPKVQKASSLARAASRTWSYTKFPLMVAGIALAISAAAAFCNPAYSQKKGKAAAPIEQGDTAVASRFRVQHASRTGESIVLVSALKIGGSSEMKDTSYLRYEDKLVLGKYDIMKLEGTAGTLKLRSYRLYLDKKTSTIYIFESPQTAPRAE
ncbi:MAG: hypothetical protein WC263_02735 [Candidatus Micrarchaeia archaeon]|jgi:hypothetical protein